MNLKSIIIVDDHKIVRDGLRAILIGNKKFKITAEAESGKELLDLLKDKKPDIIILDLSLSDYDGIDLISPILSQYPECKILILTANMEEEVICESVKRGATGFLHKDTSSEEFLEALDNISAGEPYYGQKISHIIYKSYTKKIKEKNLSNHDLEISEREKEVIILLAEGLSFKEVAEKLFISPRTVENHKNNILGKLGLRNIIDLVRYAIKNKIISL